jgi:hypothetical protein
VSALFHGVLFSWFRSQNYILQPSYFQGAGQSECDGGLNLATTLMKSNDAKKETKKAPQKTAKEKKLAKQEKKAKR